MKKLLKTIWSVAWPVGIYLLISVVVETGYSLYLIFREYFAAGTFDMNHIIDIAMEQSLNTTGVVSLISMIVFIIIIAADRKKHPEDKEKTYPNVTAAAFMAAIGCCLVGNLVLAWMGITANDEAFNQLSDIIANSALWVQILVTVFLGPVTEELLFRGIVYRRIERSYGFRAGAIVSALLFGALHGNISQFIYAFLLGMLFAYGYFKSGHLWVCILMHLLANAASMIVEPAAIAFGDSEAFYIAAFAVGVILLVTGLIMMIKSPEESKKR